MEIKKPESMDECIYFTNRAIGDGYAMAWAYRKECPKCKKPTLGKPLNKRGKVDKKAPYYECKICKYKENNEQVEKDLKLEVQYKCPYCSFESETTTEYKRKTFEGFPSYVFECGKCSKKIGITKKLKGKKAGFEK
ncbi:hypothetical protein HYX01_00930 [Candidatus Woesearchaeota archaeon]|nr:hypothetical protein [Candidatus Woesearchaeota archaeon]